MNFIPRYTPQESSQDPVDLAAVHSDDALIEMLRASSGPAHRARHQSPQLRSADRIRRTGSGGDFDESDSGAELFDLGIPTETLFDDASTGPIEISIDTSTGRHHIPAMASAAGPDNSAGPDNFTGDGNSDDALTSLLQAWRAELSSEPLPDPLSITDAIAILRSAPTLRRSVRPVMAIAAAIFALLMGSAAIGSRSAGPEDILWPVTQLLWSDRADSVIAGRDARQGLDSASEAMVAGHPEAAVVALKQVTVILTRVQEQDGRVTLESDYQRVSAELEKRMTTEVSSTPTTTETTGQSSTNTTNTPPPSSTPVVGNSGSNPPVLPPPPTTSTTTTITTPVAPTTSSTPSTPVSTTPPPSETPPVTSDPPVETETPSTPPTTETTTTEVTTAEVPSSSPADTPNQQGDQVQPNNGLQGDQQVTN